MMRRQPNSRVKLSIKNALIKELMLWSHSRRDVVRAEVLCCHYPGAENWIRHQSVLPSQYSVSSRTAHIDNRLAAPEDRLQNMWKKFK